MIESEPDLSKVTAVLVAHCDDFELGMGGTAAKLAAQGWTFHVFVLCSHRRRGDDKDAATVDTIRKLREEEALRGAEVLGIPRSQVHFLNAGENEDERALAGRIHRQLETIYDTYRPAFPFVFTHCEHDRHADHVSCNKIASAAFRMPILKFAVASSTEADFEPDICVDTSDYFEQKVSAFEQHGTQAELKAGTRPILDVLREFDGRCRQATGFRFSECFEVSLLAVGCDIDPILSICDSAAYRQRLVAKLAVGDAAAPPRAKPRILLSPNPSCAAMLRSGRLPFSFGYTAVDGCAEIFATPSDENRYGGFGKAQVRCTITSETWNPGQYSSNPEATQARLQEALRAWRKQTSYPRALRTLLTVPAEPVTDRQGVELLFGRSDYFTVRTITEISRGATFDDALGSLFPAPDWWADNHSRFGIDVPPYHVSVQGIILNRDPETGSFALVLTATNSRSNPIMRGIGVSMAEQMTAHGANPSPAWWHEDRYGPPPHGEGDMHIFDTLERGLFEEFSLRREDYQTPVLLNACLEADMYFITFIFAVRTELTSLELFDRWRRAPDRQESEILALVPIGRGAGGIPPANAVSSIARLLELSELDLSEFLIPRAMPPGSIAPQGWHPSSRMRLYAAAKHWWGDRIDEFVRFDN